MHRVIVPVDFSENSFNAARFTGQMLSGKKDAIIILYHNYDREDEATLSGDYLANIQKELIGKGDAQVECIKEHGGDLIDNIEKLAASQKATLITMGITGKTGLKQIFMGSNTLKMVDRKSCPVMIIPPAAEYHEIRNVLFASDFKEIEKSTPVALLTSVLEMFKPDLHIVNVDPKHYVSITEEYQMGKTVLRNMFKDYNTEFYFIGMNDFQEAIDNFIRDYKIDLLITIPRHHSLAAGLFKSTHTKKLVFHSRIPILAAHE